MGKYHIKTKDKNIGFHKNARDQILWIYQDISENINRSFDKKYQWGEN